MRVSVQVSREVCDECERVNSAHLTSIRRAHSSEQALTWPLSSRACNLVALGEEREIDKKAEPHSCPGHRTDPGSRSKPPSDSWAERHRAPHRLLPFIPAPSLATWPSGAVLFLTPAQARFPAFPVISGARVGGCLSVWIWFWL